MDYLNRFLQHNLSYSGVSGSLATFTTSMIFYPADTVKNRLQVQSKVAGVSHTTTGAFVRILRAEGVRSLYSGLSMRLVYAAPSSFVSFTVYELVRRMDSSWWEQALAFSIPRVTTSAFRTPFDIVKQKMQCVREIHGAKARVSFLEVWHATKYSELFRGMLMSITRDLIIGACFAFGAPMLAQFIQRECPWLPALPAPAVEIEERKRKREQEREQRKRLQEEQQRLSLGQSASSSSSSSFSALTDQQRSGGNGSSTSSINSSSSNNNNNNSGSGGGDNNNAAVTPHRMSKPSLLHSRKGVADFVAGALAMGTAVVLTQPLDVVKTRWQLNSMKKWGDSAWGVFKNTLREEGFRGMMTNGLTARLIRYMPSGSLGWGLYNVYYSKITSLTYDGDL